MKTKILFVIENEAYGGGERAFAQIIRGLDKGRFDVYAACLTGTAGSAAFIAEIERHAKVLRLDLSRLLNFGAVPALRRLIAENGVSLVHSQGARADFYCRMALDGSVVRHVCTVASPVEEYDVGPLKKAAYMVADRFLGSRVDMFVAVAGHIGRKLREKGAPPEKVRVIYNGVDALACGVPPPAAARARAELGVADGDFLAAAFCRLSAEKGLFTLLDAADLCAGLPISFAVAGAGPLERDLKARAEELGLAGKFLFAGFLPDVMPLLHAADAALLPSSREGFPMSALEAMAAGKPVVGSRIEGLDECVEDGRTGLLVPPGDYEALASAVKRLAADRELAGRLGAAGRAAAAEKFGLDRMVAAHEEVYVSLLRGE